MRICTGQDAPPAVIRVLAELGSCCLGAAEEGPGGCSCWEPVYDLEQSTPIKVIVPGQRAEMCADCAYRPDSPERTGDDRHACSDDGELDDIARSDNPFWCHQGLRKPISFRHATLGVVVPADADAYDPPMRIIDGRKIPIKADGTAGDRCAGWLARKHQLAVADV